MNTTVILALVVAGVLLLALLYKVIKTPIKWAFKLLVHAAIGFVALFVINLLGQPIGLQLGLNWLNAVVAGVLGVPGVILLILLKYLL